MQSVVVRLGIESLHHSLPFPQRQMRVFGAVVQASVRSILDRGYNLTPRLAMGTKFVCDDALGWASLLFHQPDQQAPGSLGVAAGLDDLIENITILVDGSPKPMFVPADRHDNLVQMPQVIWV